MTDTVKWLNDYAAQSWQSGYVQERLREAASELNDLREFVDNKTGCWTPSDVQDYVSDYPNHTTEEVGVMIRKIRRWQETNSESIMTRCPVCEKFGGHTHPGNCEGPPDPTKLSVKGNPDDE